MSETTTSILNKNTLLYGKGVTQKNFGPDSVDGKGKEVKGKSAKPDMAPIKSIREK